MLSIPKIFVSQFFPFLYFKYHWEIKGEQAFSASIDRDFFIVTVMDC